MRGRQPIKRTHSNSSPFTWADLLAEAYGELGLHPWEFDLYTMSDYLARRKGYMNKDLNDWHKVRIMSYYSAVGYLKKGTKLTDIIPLPGDPKRLKDLKGDELKDWFERRKQLEIKAGLRDG